MLFRLTLMLAVVFPAITGVRTAATQIVECLPPEQIGGIYYDSDGLIVHRPTPDHLCGDGGDTAQREGWYWLGVWIRQNVPGLPPYVPNRRLTFDQVLQLLEPNRDGIFHRHPKLAPWNNPHSKEFGFSRDQMVPLVAAMGVWGKQDALRRLWDALPEDVLGKHTFNGNWRNLLGQDGVDCGAIKRRGCDATRDCPLRVDTRDCSLQVDNRSCPLQEDTRDCEKCLVPNFITGGCVIRGNDPICEIAKATQNAIYKANKDACEAAKAAQNVIYAGNKVACEAAKATQNAIYKAEKDACEVAKATEKAACEVQKAIDLNVCRLNNVHSGDFVGPATENLFSRAMNQSLAHSLGEPELLANALLRVSLASDRDNTGDDLNLIVMLVMSQLRSTTDISRQAVAAYAGLRPFSFGSYLETYRNVYGRNDPTDMAGRIDRGIRQGWRPDAPPTNGAVRWYHRLETGGIPALAELYDPVIDRFIYGDDSGTFSTQNARNLPPQVASISPANGVPDGGTPITILGANFVDGTTVLVGGVPASEVTVSGSMITAITPQHDPGIVDVAVTVPWPGGGTAILENGFSYQIQEELTPEDPSKLVATVNGSNVRLTWAAAARATSYVIEAGSGSGLSDLTQQDVGPRTELLTNAPAGIYFVRVRSKNGHGVSGPSNEVVLTVSTESQVPDPPGGLSVNVTGAHVTLAWQPSLGATSYVLEAGTAPGIANVFSGDLGTATTVSGDVPNGTYFARVKAKNVAGTSAPSSEVTFTSRCEAPSPVSLTVSQVGQTVTLTWTPSASASSYVLEAGSASGLANLFKGDVGMVLRLDAVAPAGMYFVRVRGRNGCGAISASNEVVVTVP